MEEEEGARKGKVEEVGEPGFIGHPRGSPVDPRTCLASRFPYSEYIFVPFAVPCHRLLPVESKVVAATRS